MWSWLINWIFHGSSININLIVFQAAPNPEHKIKFWCSTSWIFILGLSSPWLCRLKILEAVITLDRFFGNYVNCVKPYYYQIGLNLQRCSPWTLQKGIATPPGLSVAKYNLLPTCQTQYFLFLVSKCYIANVFGIALFNIMKRGLYISLTIVGVIYFSLASAL